MQQQLNTPADAKAVVEAAGLRGKWFPFGTAKGFADWLFLYRNQADPQALSSELVDYIDSWMAYEHGPDADQVWREEVARHEHARDRLLKASQRASALIAQLKGSPCGRLAFCALRYLATSAGRSIGPRKQTVDSLEMLTKLLEQLRLVFKDVRDGTVGLAVQRYRSPRRRDWVTFRCIERHLIETPLTNDEAPRRAVAHLLAVSGDVAVVRLLDAQLVAAKMRPVVERGAATACSTTGPRRLRRAL